MSKKFEPMQDIISPYAKSKLNNDFKYLFENVNMQGKTIQDLVAEGQLTPAQYAELISVINGHLKSGDVSLNDLDPQVLEAINNGDGTPFEILSIPRDKSVTPTKTTYFKRSTKNLFNGEYLSNYTFWPDDGDYGAIHYTNSGDRYIAVIEINPDVTYTVTKMKGGNRFNVLLVNDYPNQTGAVYAIKSSHRGAQDGSQQSYTFKNDVGAKYVIIQTNLGVRELPGMQVERGSEFTSYEPGMYIPKAYTEGLKPKEITPVHTSFFETSKKNLFEGEYIDGYLLYVESSNNLIMMNSTSTIRGKTAVVNVQPETTYTIKIHDVDKSNLMRIGVHNEPPVFLDSHTSRVDDLVFTNSAGDPEKEYTFTTGSEAQYALIYVSNNGQEPRLQVEEGDVATSFERPSFIPHRYLDLPTQENSNKSPYQKDDKFNIVGDFHSLYMKKPIEDYISNPSTITPQELNDMFIDVSENHEGASYSLIGVDDFGYNIYQYETKPLEYYEVETDASNSGNDDGAPMKSPKIVISAGVHGRERSASFAAYQFYRELLVNPTNNPVIEAIRTNLHIIIVPVVCPSGFEDNTYTNRNGQNLNRDFPPHGNVSQKESQYLKSVLDDHADMDYFIDFHNMFMRNGLIGYSLTDNDFFKYSTLNMYRAVGRGWQKEHDQMPQSFTHRWAYTAASNVGTVGRYVNDELGVPSVLLELARESAWLGGGDHGEPVARMGVDILVNMISLCVKNKM